MIVFETSVLECAHSVQDRIAGASSEVNALKDAMNRGRIALLDDDIFPERYL